MGLFYSGTVTPSKLADEIVKTLGDADSDTALTALDIARLLLVHRIHAQAEFERKCISGLETA